MSKLSNKTGKILKTVTNNTKKTKLSLIVT
jgi:hypothetical protein